MSVPTNTLQTFTQIGRKEDVSNMIFNIDPEETPAVSGIKKTKATNTAHEWQIDSLDTASTNAKVEGDDATFYATVVTTRLKNFCQILSKGVRVSRTARVSATYGRTDELTYQLDKRMAELKRDLELQVTQNSAATTGAASTAAKFAGMESWIASNYTTCGSAEATTPGQVSGYVNTAPTDSSSAGAITQALLESVIQQAWTAGGDPGVIMVCGRGKVKISGFTGIATRFQDVGSSAQANLVTGVDLIKTNFGLKSVVPNRFMRTSVVLVLDMKMWALATFDAFQIQKLAKTGDADQYQIIGQYTLESRNEKASGKVSDVNFAL